MRSTPFHQAAEQLLRRDIAAVYLRSDVPTRLRYHAVLARWSARGGLAPADIARRALARAEAAREASGPGAAGAHIGYHLLGDGASDLEDEVVPCRSRRELISRAMSRRPSTVIPALITTIAALLVGSATATAVELGAPAVCAAALTLAAVPLAFAYASRSVRATWLRRPHLAPLPRLLADDPSLAPGLTFIVVPVLVPSAARARTLLGMLARLAEAHADTRFRFALLSDFADAPQEKTSGDTEILTALEAGADELNLTGRDDVGDRFFVLHRRRTWSATQQAWIGWERKRGKLLELLRLLDRDPQPSTYAWKFGDLSALLERADVPNFITLDETTWMEPGEAFNLVRAAAHPLNCPRIAAASRRPTGGYGMLQPSVLFLPPGADRAEYGAPNGGEGLPPRGRRLRSPSFYFAAMGVGQHMGAGALYNVRACHRVLDGAFPPEIVLHHDMLDGFAARTGEMANAQVVQAWPSSYLAQSRRGHRWLRGVFQASPWLAPTVRDASGARGPNPLRSIHRFFIAELALMELSKPASLVVLLGGWTVLPGSPFLWTLIACPPLVSLVATAFRAAANHVGMPFRWASGQRGHPAARAATSMHGLSVANTFSAAFSLAMIAFEAALVLDALMRTTWRLAVSRRRLLDWTTRRALDATHARDRADYWRALWPSPAIAAAALALVVTARPASLPIAAPFLMAWLVVPELVRLADRHVFGGGAAA